jgi:hypothetical protein
MPVAQLHKALTRRIEWRHLGPLLRLRRFRSAVATKYQVGVITTLSSHVDLLPEDFECGHAVSLSGWCSRAVASGVNSDAKAAAVAAHFLIGNVKLMGGKSQKWPIYKAILYLSPEHLQTAGPGSAPGKQALVLLKRPQNPSAQDLLRRFVYSQA